MNRIKIEIKWALIYTVMTLIWMLLEKLSGLHSTYIQYHPIYTNLIIIPAVVIYVYALQEKRKKYYKDEINYRQSVISGLIMTAIVVLMIPLSQYVSSAVISPDYFINMKDYVVKEGIMSMETANENFNLRNHIFQGMIGTAISGLLIVLVVSIFVSKKLKRKL